MIYQNSTEMTYNTLRRWLTIDDRSLIVSISYEFHSELNRIWTFEREKKKCALPVPIYNMMKRPRIVFPRTKKEQKYSVTTACITYLPKRSCIDITTIFFSTSTVLYFCIYYHIEQIEMLEIDRLKRRLR